MRLSWGLRFGGGFCPAEQPQSGRALGKRVILSLEKAKAQNSAGWAILSYSFALEAEEDSANILFTAAHCFEFLSAVPMPVCWGWSDWALYPRLLRVWTICYHRCSCYTSAGQCFWTMTLGFKHLQTNYSKIIANYCPLMPCLIFDQSIN